MKKWVFYLLLVLITIGCRRKDGKIEFSCPGKEKEIVFWHAMGGPLGETLESLVNDFTKQYPKYKIRLVNCGNYNALSQKVMASLAAKNTPTIAQVFPTQVAVMIKSDRIHRLDEMPNANLVIKRTFPVLIRENTWNDQLWSIPFNKSVQVVYYNVEEFKKNGLKPATSWTEFDQLVDKLTRKDENGKTLRYGLGMSLSTWTFQNFLSLAGGELLDKDGNPQFHNETGIKTLSFLLNLIHKKKTAKVLEGFEIQNEFLAGNIGMVLGSCASYSFMKQISRFKLGVFHLPADKKALTIVSGTNIVLFKGKPADQTEGAWRFLEWLTEPKQSVKWSMATSYAPLNPECFQDKEYLEYLDKIPGLKDAYLTMQNGDMEPRFSFWVDGRKILSDHLEKCLIKEDADPKKELTEAAQEISAIKERESK
ncbi:MAG: ABC transporter substrate-binding protein [Candidatus Coatesbacteria bacterium]|nr:ABC transporter substrate-binding protein [Candidatus Coatesbacteria bacterium]